MNSARIWMISVVLMAAALLLLLAQHWGMALSNADDPWITRLGVEGSIDTAKTQGRFWLVPVLFLAQVPFLLDGWALANSIKIAINGLVFLSFVLFCSKLTNKYIGVLAGLVWLALIDINSSNYSPIHGFLLMFNLQFIFLFVSFYLFLDRLERPDDTRVVIAPYLYYAFAMLAYEPMLFYALAFPALYLYKQIQVQDKKISLLQHALNFHRRNWVLFVVILAYVVLYFGFRKFMATGTRGIDAGSSISEVVKTIYAFSIHGFHFELKPLTAAVIEQFSAASVATALLYAAMVGVALLLLIPRITEEQVPTALYRKSSLLVLVFFLISPNILFGFVDAYRKWANYDPHYVGNYFSSFPLAMLITLGLLYLVGGGKARREKILFALILYVFTSAACDNYLRWESLAGENRNDNTVWQKAMDNLSQSKFDQKKTIVICGMNAPRNISGDDEYWSYHLSRRLLLDVQYVSNKISLTSCDVKLDFRTGLTR